MNTMSGLISPSLATAVFVWSETHVAPEAEVQGKFSIGAGTAIHAFFVTSLHCTALHTDGIPTLFLRCNVVVCCGTVRPSGSFYCVPASNQAGGLGAGGL